MTQIFLDGGDPAETQEIHALLKKTRGTGLDGQTTNPSLIAKTAQKEAGKTEKLTPEEAFAAYRSIVTKMHDILEGKSVSIQVIGDPNTMTAEEMVAQGRDRMRWIANPAIKVPCTREGLTAASVLCKEGNVNVTLVFSQSQAAAVSVATAEHGETHTVFVSPFVGRLDDVGENGMDVIANILRMYRQWNDTHVSVLTASVRTMEHFQYALSLGSGIITAPGKVLRQWAAEGCSLPDATYAYPSGELKALAYQELSQERSWEQYDITHPLTTKGLARFWDDWKSVVNTE